MVRSDIPQGLWGLGNTGTCNMNGFLFLVGMTTVPMYTLCLCIYYVCKIKGKMNDAQFATKIEKKMHIFIIVSNLGLFLTAMGMGTINPGVLGNICTTAAFPTGCRQNPEMFGECDPFIAKAAAIYVLITSAVPMLCFVGIVGCMAILFWNVLLMDKIFGTGARGRLGRAPSRAENMDGIIATSTRRITGTAPFRRSREESSSIVVIDAESSFPLRLESSEETSFGQNDLILDPSGDEENCLSVSNPQSLANDRNDDICEKSSRSEYENIHNAQASSNLHENIQVNRDPESISRLYKKELVKQACGYVAVFCTTIFICTAFNISLILGIPPGKDFVLATCVLYPLGGLFNILVYTRPSVASFLRKCPECSQLSAFWLVLKAGGEVPDENEWRDAQQQRRSLSGIFRLPFVPRKEATLRNQEVCQVQVNDDSCNHGQVVFANQEAISDLPFGMPSHPPLPDESLPNSASGINGLSQSIESGDVAHRSREDWSHLEGEGSRMAAIPEGDSSALESSNEILVSQEHAVDVSSTLSSSASQKVEKCREDDWDNMWEDTFKRVRRWTPSM